VTVELAGGAILDGAIDLLYEQPDGQLVIVDYKTDRVSEADFASRAESYRPQGTAYAQAVRSATGKDVSHVALVFAALGGRVSEIDPSSEVDDLLEAEG
jgi:ATP-dependent exoDNAse (exonuclease V) beta subunit